jgi:hypothetical protein
MQAFTRTASLICCVTSLLAGQTASTLCAELQTGETIELAVGKMQVTWRPASHTRAPDLLIHFHGDVTATTRNFAEARIDGVLVTINYKGLSSAYSRPLQESPHLFQDVLDKAMHELRKRERATDETRWGRVCVSSFSAGYGAVREILKNPECFQRIEGILAADSIYAGLQPGTAERRVNRQQMRDFRRFAQLACESKKTFVVTHSYIETPYASTLETADDLLGFVGVKRETLRLQVGEPLVLRSRANQGRLTVLGYEGDTGETHMKHLRNIATWWRLLPLRKLP